VRVVEISMYVQGPTAGLVLASMGADVIKIEQVGRQDIMRNQSSLYGVRLDERGQAWQYAALNRGKRALSLDLTTERGAEVFHRLIASADVFVTNLREDGLARMGADPETLRGFNPRLIYARGGGFALRGPLADDACQDTVGMAYGGFMDITSDRAEPNYPPGALSDVLTGTNLASAVLAGLVRRSITGKGEVVGTTQVQSLLWLQLLPVGMASSIGARMARFDRTSTSNPLFSVYPTKDGWLAIAVIHPHQWPPLAEAIGLEALVEDPRFDSFENRARNRGAFIQILEECFSQKTTQEWWHVLRAAGVWSSPVNKVTDLAVDEYVLENEYLVNFPDGFVGPAAPFEVGSWRGHRAVAADYGEHTDEILGELGFGEEDLVDLRVAGAIW
jgi:crotonobetainyl-CoA:carnitine CoA-transferase CaiB-like acyl-CoA transferase